MHSKPRAGAAKNGGQILIILLLIVLVGLTVALAASQRATISLNNSDKNDQSSRSYDAAEAAIEQAISNNLQSGSTTITLPNQSTATVTAATYPHTGGAVPTTRGGAPSYRGVRNSVQTLEYLEPVDRYTTAVFWLDNPNCGDYTKPGNALTCAAGQNYLKAGNNFQIYFGNITVDPSSTDAPAIEVNLVTSDSSGNYINHRVVYDADSSRALTSNNFIGANCRSAGSSNYYSLDTTFGSARPFKCVTPSPGISIPPGETPVLIRTRFLYSNEAQVIALEPEAGYSLPSQATVYTATGYSGQTIHKLQRFVMPGVVSPLLDFSIFSASNLNI